KGWYSSTDQYTTGQIDEVRIWKTARTAEQVMANLYQPLKGDTGANLLAVYHFDELEGDTAYNSVCGAEHGVWMGTPKPMSVVSGAMIKSLAAPSSVCAQPGNGQVDISWDAVAEAASGYEVIYGTDSIMVTDSQPVPSGTIATITGLTNNSL